MGKIYIILFLLPFSFLVSLAQDAQLSQFYAAPLYLNPGLAGATQGTRAAANYRNQWTGMNNGAFSTYAFSFDHYVDKFNSGIGVLVMHDTRSAGLNYNFAAIQYAYQVNLSPTLTFRPALQAAYGNMNINYNHLRFPNQYTDQGFDPTSVSTEGGKNAQYIDFSTGGVLYSENFFGGIAINHLNHPSLSYNSSIPVKFSLHGGVKIPLSTGASGRAVSITPVFNFKKQAKFEQLDLGAYLDFEPLVFGFWYRGIPVKVEKSAILNNDALVFLAGLKTGKLSFGYSYDLTISGLGSGTGGSHELSVLYDFKMGERYPHKKKPPMNQRYMPCPKF